MSIAQYSNNAESILANNVLAADTSLSVAAGDGALFPSLAANQHAIVTLTDGSAFEMVKITAVAADIFTVQRAQDGTAAQDWAAGSTVSQRLTAGAFQALLDMEGTKANSIRAGAGSSATGVNSVAIGQSCIATSSRSVAVGRGCNATYSDAVSIGSQCDAYYNNAVAVGLACVSSYYYCSSIGHKSTASSYYALAVGYNAKAISDSATAIGRGAISSGASDTAIGSATSANGGFAVAIGASSKASAPRSTAIGRFSQATAPYGIALGADTLNTQARSAMIRAPITVRAPFNSSKPELDFAGAEVVLMTNSINLGAIGVPQQIIIPAGLLFLPTSAGVIVTSQTGVVTTQPTFEVSTSVDGITYTPMAAASITISLNAPRTFEELAIGPFTAGVTRLQGKLTAPAVSTLIYQVRFYFKGIMVQE